MNTFMRDICTMALPVLALLSLQACAPSSQSFETAYQASGVAPKPYTRTIFSSADF